MTDMVPISSWWFTLDLATRQHLHANPAASISADLAGRIHDAGGVLYEAGFLTGDGDPGFELLPDDVEWIADLEWIPAPE